MNRTPLTQRILPTYSRGEEIFNTITHFLGLLLGIATLWLCLAKTIPTGNSLAIFSATVYGFSMIALYTMSTVYHSLPSGIGKKVFQILDHCTIYLLIAGTYTPISLIAVGHLNPTLGWSVFIFQWIVALFSIVLNAIDLKVFRFFSMIGYIGLGWAVLAFLPTAFAALTATGFGYLLAGGIVYTIGTIFYAIGSKKKWFHSVFHIFVVLGSLLHLFSVLGFVL